MATTEKAFLDTRYLSTRNKRRFSKLPEPDLIDSEFERNEFGVLLHELPYPARIRSAIQARYQKSLDLSP